MTSFDSQITFDPAADFAALLAKVPAKWVVYLMSDEQGAPIQLLCVKNLRASLQRRLGENEQIGPSKRVGYRDLVRQIAWRRVDSAFEADLVYLQMAREIFPQTYRGMLAFKDAWFLHIDPTSQFPRYTKTNDPTSSSTGSGTSVPLILTPSSGTPGEGRGGGQLRTPILIGPIKDKDSAGRLIELIEDTFDLCRYYNVLLESPHGKPCAYKEMGRCAAPCDGSETMEQYRQTVHQSIEALLNPQKYRAECEAAMQRAAAEQNYELAGKIKLHLERGQRLHAGALSHLRALSKFQYLALQRGPGEKKGKLFLISPGMCEELLGLISPEVNWQQVLEYARLQMDQPTAEFDHPSAERTAIVASHLFMPKKQGVILAWDEVNEKALATAYRQLAKQKPEEDSTDEGVVKDLQVM